MDESLINRVEVTAELQAFEGIDWEREDDEAHLTIAVVPLRALPQTLAAQEDQMQQRNIPSNILPSHRNLVAFH